jgi:hypothetical protein
LRSVLGCSTALENGPFAKLTSSEAPHTNSSFPAKMKAMLAWDFFTGKNAPEEDKWRFKKWRNEITLRSLEMYSEYEPGAFIERIAPTRSSW